MKLALAGVFIGLLAALVLTRLMATGANNFAAELRFHFLNREIRWDGSGTEANLRD